MAPDRSSAPWHWDTVGAVSNVEMGQSPPGHMVREGRTGGVPFLQGNAEFGSTSPSHRLVCAKAFKLAASGDTLISVRAPVGALNLADRTYCIGRGLAAVRFRGNGSFGYHAMALHSAALRRLAQGSTFEAVSGEHLRGLRFPSPALWEQARIAEVLDTVDEAIRSTERVIAKLEQVKRGLLHDLLTRGIDDNGEIRDPDRHPEQFKDSPLGQIPRTWEAVRLGEIVRRHGGLLQTGPFGSQLHAREYTEKGVPVLMPQDLVGADVRSDRAARVAEATAQRMAKHRLAVGDVVLSRRGDLEKAAPIGPEHVGWLCGTGCLLARLPVSILAPEWFVAVYRHHIGQRQVLARAVGSTMVNLNTSILASLLVPVSREREQVWFGLAMRASREELRGHQLELDKLRLLKKGLMDDLLTGRVRVPVPDSDHA